jgi:DNA repair exonuclease SbcCD nuclease subunit
MVSFIHTADFHFGANRPSWCDASVHQVQLDILNVILQEASKQRVDFILFAGDLYDGFANEKTIRDVYEVLRSTPVPLYILPGNHDREEEGGVWSQPPWDKAPAASIRVLREVGPFVLGSSVVLLSCPVQRRAPYPALVDSWLKTPFPRGSHIRIGVAHGHLEGLKHPCGNFPVPRHSAAALALDYLALGHRHEYAVFPVDGVNRIAYPGTPSPMLRITGWYRSYHDNNKVFRKSRRGRIIHVRLDEPEAAPQISWIPVGFEHKVQPGRILE